MIQEMQRVWQRMFDEQEYVTPIEYARKMKSRKRGKRWTARQ